MLVAVPIIGRMTSNVIDRMQEMSKKEVGTLNTMIQEQPQTVEADSFPRALTEDEELLQIIDFNHKRDYSLQVMNKVEIPDVNMKDPNTMDLVEKAEYIIESIYGINTKNLEAYQIITEELVENDTRLFKQSKDNEPKNAKRGVQRVEFEMDVEE